MGGKDSEREDTGYRLPVTSFQLPVAGNRQPVTVSVILLALRDYYDTGS
ncbi:MAG: hypothetical protein JWQ40_922 [Segetibacter sp.]|jgi:hypothetical protein|nr:hypothetical protein [Segetibacter sp.]